MLYHAHWSLGLDFMILAKTPAVLLFGHGAYQPVEKRDVNDFIPVGDV